MCVFFIHLTNKNLHMWTEILIGVAALIGGGLAGYLITRTATKNTLKQAEEKGEAIKRNKLLEAKEK